MRNSGFNFKKFLQQKKIIVSFIVFCLGEVFSVAILNEKNMSKSILTILGNEVNLGFVLIVIFLIAFLLFLAFEYANQRVKEAENQIELAEQEKQKWEETRKNFNLASIEDKGKILFNLAIGLDTYEPVKYKMLEEAAIKYNHPLSAIYLGNLYHSGLIKDKKIIIEKNYEKAYELYIKAVDFDTTGIALWRLGWMYELGQAPDASKNQVENQITAFDYYKISSKYHYPKAYNSLGKFYAMGYAGLIQNSVKAGHYYEIADEGGDAFATLNSAYIHSEKEDEYPCAVDCFKRAMAKDSPLAYLKFADFLVKNYNYFKEEYSHWDVLEFYCKAIELTNGDISAKAYFNLGQVLKNDELGFSEHKERITKKLSLDLDNDIEKVCTIKACDILENLSQQGVRFTDSTQAFYAKIKNYIDNSFVWSEE